MSRTSVVERMLELETLSAFHRLNARLLSRLDLASATSALLAIGTGAAGYQWAAGSMLAIAAAAGLASRFGAAARSHRIAAQRFADLRDAAPATPAADLLDRRDALVRLAPKGISALRTPAFNLVAALRCSAVLRPLDLHELVAERLAVESLAARVANVLAPEHYKRQRRARQRKQIESQFGVNLRATERARRDQNRSW